VHTSALWVTSWPFAEYVRHAWPGAWINSLFRNESTERSSDLIRAAIAVTCAVWPVPPPNGMVSFVDPRHVPGVPRRGARIYGYCYLRAGFSHVGYTRKHRLWVWQLLPDAMPAPDYSVTAPLFEVSA
jgi:hypothetical protein